MKRRAFVIILVAVALLLIASTIRSGWLYLVASVLLALVVAGAVSGRLTNRRLEISRECPPEAFEGDPLGVTLRVRNPGRLTRYFIMVEDRGTRRPERRALSRLVKEHRAVMREPARTESSPEGAPEGGAPPRGRPLRVAVEKVAPGSQVEVSYELEAPRRGVYNEANLRVVSGGVFGAAESSRTVRLEAAMLVYPRVHHLAYFPFAPRSMAAPLESFEWSRKGIGQDYYGVREYVRGDSLKHVHWKSSARHGGLIVREYQQEYRPFSGLVVLLAEPRYGDDDENSLEDGLRCAASILNYYEAMGSRTRLVVPRNGEFEVLRDTTLYGGLRALAAYTPFRLSQADVGGGMSEAMTHIRAALVPGAAVAVVTNAGSGQVATMMEAVPDIEGASLVVVADGSYGGEWDSSDLLLEASEMEQAASRRVNLFVMARGREIGACLSEPLVTIAG